MKESIQRTRTTSSQTDYDLKGKDMGDFDYGKAEADLFDVGCHNPEEVYGYKSEKGFNEFMRENGLNPDRYRSNNNTGSSGTNGCFITSACVEAEGLGDDCEELNVLRRYRDTFLRYRDGGEADIKEYYSIAPKIVKAINEQQNAKELWDEIYQKMVRPCVSFIKEGNNEAAYKLYRGYVQILAKY